MTFVEALWPILARRSNAVVDRSSLERGGTLTGNHERQRTEEFDRKRISTFRYTQYIVDEGMLLIRSEVLLSDRFVYPWRNFWHCSKQLSEGARSSLEKARSDPRRCKIPTPESSCHIGVAVLAPGMAVKVQIRNQRM
jgi:hypothetical protein